jgi:small-conductance mechanosensitive channel
VALSVLSSLGVDIAPLLAGAGVVGLAIGFGAQSLVKDVVSGVFFLIDDAFRIGEYVEFGDLRGEVEKISIRSLRLRHHRGAIHTVPFGEIKAITNYNRDWVIMKLKISLKYGTDVEQVRKLVKRLGQEMIEHPDYGKLLLEPPKSQGILEFGDYGVILRVKFKSKPREQFVLRRVINERLKAAFEAHGIEFAYPTVTIDRAGAPETAAAQRIVKQVQDQRAG